MENANPDDTPAIFMSDKVLPRNERAPSVRMYVGKTASMSDQEGRGGAAAPFDMFAVTNQLSRCKSAPRWRCWSCISNGRQPLGWPMSSTGKEVPIDLLDGRSRVMLRTRRKIVSEVGSTGAGRLGRQRGADELDSSHGELRMGRNVIAAKHEPGEWRICRNLFPSMTRRSRAADRRLGPTSASRVGRHRSVLDGPRSGYERGVTCSVTETARATRVETMKPIFSFVSSAKSSPTCRGIYRPWQGVLNRATFVRSQERQVSRGAWRARANPRIRTVLGAWISSFNIAEAMLAIPDGTSRGVAVVLLMLAHPGWYRADRPERYPGRCGIFGFQTRRQDWRSSGGCASSFVKGMCLPIFASRVNTTARVDRDCESLQAPRGTGVIRTAGRYLGRLPMCRAVLESDGGVRAIRMRFRRAHGGSTRTAVQARGSLACWLRSTEDSPRGRAARSFRLLPSIYRVTKAASCEVSDPRFQWFHSGIRCRNYSEIVVPLTDLLRENVKFVWTKACQTAHDRLKEAFRKDVCLARIDMAKPFVVRTDASGEAVGGILLQRCSESGRLRPVLFDSAKLKPQQKCWSPTERELLAVVWFLDKYRHILNNGMQCGVKRWHAMRAP